MRRWWVGLTALLLIVGAVGAIHYRPAGELVDLGCDTPPPGPAALVAVDIHSGESLWSSRVGHASGLAYGPGVAVIGGDSGVLRGFAASSGELEWCRTVPVASEVQPKFVPAGAIVATYSSDGFVVAFDPSSGEEQWRVPLPGSSAEIDSAASTVGSDQPLRLIGGEMLWVTNGAADPSILAVINPDDGRLVEPPPPLPSEFKPGDTVEEMGGLRLRSSHSTTSVGRQALDLLMIDAETNAQLWNRTVPGYVTTMATTKIGSTSVLVIDQTDALSVGRDEKLLSAYNATDGSLVWERPLPLAATGVYTGEPGAVIVPSGTNLVAISVDSGETLWSSDEGSPGRQRPYTVDGFYREVVHPPGSDTYIGLIVAERPYRD